ncbi:class I SAM-dependent methyltransferase [Aetokthonos hydrillicola CCALA 1050]|nr:class I SAM-dependent methyltransferase [Aetokthonos hydrillicola CCALA 1050]
MGFHLNLLTYLGKSRDYVFSNIFSHNRWLESESVSGPGSTLEQTAFIRKMLPLLLKELNVKSVLDAPCGDFYWMKEVELDLDEYWGGDIVPDLITEIKQKYANKKRNFITLDIVADQLPTVDLIFCRDCFVHLPFKDIITAIKNFKTSGSTYLLTTTYPGGVQKNKDIIIGNWRAIDLQLSPFNFSPPIKVINEQTTESGDLPEKSLGLWKLADIPL